MRQHLVNVGRLSRARNGGTSWRPPSIFTDRTAGCVRLVLSQWSSPCLWICLQRRAFEQGDIPLSKKILLERLPGWDQNAHQLDLDQRWKSHLRDFQDFVATHGQMPRYKNYSSELERRLRAWLHNQHQRRSQGNLLVWRREALNTVAPSWKSRM